MLKHYFDKHGEEKLEEMEFGGRIIDKPKSAFNRQISESVLIQHQKQKNHILNSKSEYNRCALPRLTANLGEIPVERMEKDLNEKKRKEKEEERELQKKIRDLKVRRGMARREKVREMEQPANKRRKIENYTYKRVLKVEREEGEKRSIEIQAEAAKEEENATKKMRKVETGCERLPEGLEYEGGRKKTEKELLKEWNERIAEREEFLLREEKERCDRIEKAKRMQKGWELMRLCRNMIEENGETWKKSKARRDIEREEEEQRKERKAKAAEKKKQTIEKIESRRKQQKITDCLMKLPENRKRLVEKEEEKMRKMMMEEAETELWRKWRQKKGRGMINWAQIGEKDTMEQKLMIVETQVEKYKLELERIAMRRARREDDERREEAERNRRMETKKKNEKHWEMMRWVTKFLKENSELWKNRRDDELEHRRKREEIEEWMKKSDDEKIEKIKAEKTEKPKLTREEKIKMARESSERWRNWRKMEREEEETEDMEGNDELQKGGGPPGAFLFQIKDPAIVLQAGDPPIGKERGALGVGTGPTPPP